MPVGARMHAQGVPDRDDEYVVIHGHVTTWEG